MKTLLYYPLYLATIFLYFCLVTYNRIFSFAIGGPTDWHIIMFQYPDTPLLDWWKYLIPCFITSYILIRFVPAKPRWIILGVAGSFTVFLIAISYF